MTFGRKEVNIRCAIANGILHAGELVESLENVVNRQNTTNRALAVECEADMQCARPYIRTPTGVNKIALANSEDVRNGATPFPCGRCLPCRIHKRKMITGRILMEAQLHNENTFSTLTYDDEYLPKDSSVDPKDTRNYIRKLRYHGLKFRYLVTGEYGTESQRPHYHLIIFGIGPADHSTLDRLWGKGITRHGTVTSSSAAYVAQYTVKDMCRPESEGLDGRHPEFMRSSRDPYGIGTPYLKKILCECRKHGLNGENIREVKIAGKTYPLGGYLSNLLLMDQCETHSEYIERKEQILHDYQKEILKRHIDGNVWIDEITDAKKTARQSQKKLTELYGQNKRNI